MLARRWTTLFAGLTLISTLFVGSFGCSNGGDNETQRTAQNDNLAVAVPQSPPPPPAPVVPTPDEHQILLTSPSVFYTNNGTAERIGDGYYELIVRVGDTPYVEVADENNCLIAVPRPHVGGQTVIVQNPTFEKHCSEVWPVGPGVSADKNVFNRDLSGSTIQVHAPSDVLGVYFYNEDEASEPPTVHWRDLNPAFIWTIQKQLGKLVAYGTHKSEQPASLSTILGSGDEEIPFELVSEGLQNLRSAMIERGIVTPVKPIAHLDGAVSVMRSGSNSFGTYLREWVKSLEYEEEGYTIDALVRLGVTSAVHMKLVARPVIDEFRGLTWEQVQGATGTVNWVDCYNLGDTNPERPNLTNGQVCFRQWWARRGKVIFDKVQATLATELARTEAPTIKVDPALIKELVGEATSTPAPPTDTAPQP